jgi:cytochrome b6-f complex iron-sulfur subunit
MENTLSMSSSPDDIESADNSHGPQVSRRDALLAGVSLPGKIGCAALLGTGGLWGVATVRMMFNNMPVEAARRFKVGFPADYPVGYVETKYKETHGVWLVNCLYQGRQEIVALSTACTHLGCITTWQESRREFKCPCHGSGFRQNGINFEGPAPRPLPRYAIRIAEDGQLEVDRGRTFQQQLGQWDDSDSYVEL